MHLVRSANLTQSPDELQSAIAQRRLAVLQRRLSIFVIIVGLIMVGLSAVAQFSLVSLNRPKRIQAFAPAFSGVALCVGAFLKRKRRARMTIRQLVRRSFAIVVLTVASQIPASAIIAHSLTELLHRAGASPHFRIGTMEPLMVSMFCIHLSASLILPWTLLEAATPIAILSLIGIAAMPFAPDPLPTLIAGLLILILMGVPGMFISWLRQGRLRDVVAVGFFGDRYRETQRELGYARRIHEKVFPQPLTSGGIRFDYRYEPMRQIGGDFVDLIVEKRTDDLPADLTVVLVDVTGHGIAAALAVNRLHGEIKRVTAARNDAAPGEILSALNAYVHHTLADESVFATALVLRISQRNQTVTWANAGHPPVFVVRDQQVTNQLDSTAMMLGPMSPEIYDAGQETQPLTAGSTLVAYTDGAIECRNREGDLLSIEGLRQSVEAAAGQSGDGTIDLDDLMRRIVSYRWDAADDDLLVLKVSCVGI